MLVVYILLVEQVDRGVLDVQRERTVNPQRKLGGTIGC